MMRALGAILASVVVASAHAATVRAQDCALPDIEHAVPVDGALNVPTDAVLRARYAAAAEHRGEVVVLQREGEPEESVDSEWLPAERTLVARPGELVPGARYTLRWPALTSVDGDVLGVGAVVTFEVGAGPDRGPPTFEGVRELRWDAEKTHDDCVGSAEERYRFDLVVDGASDDSGPGTLQALVYQSAGPTLSEEDPPLLVAVGAMPAAGEELGVRLPRDQSIGEVCFVVVARDLADNLSPGGEETCVVTKHPPFFGGCAAAGDGGGGAGWPVPALLLAAWLTLRRRGPRRAPGASATRSRARHRRCA